MTKKEEKYKVEFDYRGEKIIVEGDDEKDVYVVLSNILIDLLNKETKDRKKN